MIDFVFSREYARIIQAVLIDSRKTSMPLGINGNVVKTLVDKEIAKINSNVIFYKIENEQGVLVGYFSLLVSLTNKTASLMRFQLRPNFLNINTQIKTKIDDYIIKRKWKGDFLFSN